MLLEYKFTLVIICIIYNFEYCFVNIAACAKQEVNQYDFLTNRIIPY